MKANITNLKKVLRLCAKAHNVEFKDWSDEGQLGIHSENIPTTGDVGMILEEFFGNKGAMEVNHGFGWITVWLDKSMVRSKREVDMLTLQLALPYGTKLE